MDWWIWILIGFACLAAEIVTAGGIILLFFGAAGLVVGVLVVVGLGGPLWWQILLFSVLSIVSLLTLRGPILRRMTATNVESDKVDSMLGDTVILMEQLAPGGNGKAEFRGTGWNVHNLEQETLAKGQRCRIEKVEGLNLWVRKE